MSEIKVNTISERTATNGVTVDGLNIKDSKLVTADSVVTSNITDDAVTYAKIGYNANSYRNIIINGDMSLAQRATSAASITSGGYHTVDRWQQDIDTMGTWTISQSTTVPSGQGFSKSLKYDCTTADASPASGDKLNLQQRFEGQMLQYLKKGTSSAESTTLSFWVRSNKTGTYICELQDVDNSRSISKSYTISSADTWEKKTITFAGDTSGALDNDNARSLDVIWYLGAGSDLTSGTLQTSWGAKVNANRAVGQVNLADSTSNEWYITGVQWEVGTAASDFEFLPVDVNLARCQRYFFAIDESTQGNYDFALGHARQNSGGYIVFSLPTTMRTAPTGVTVANVGQFQIVTYGIVNAALTSLTFNNAGPNFIKLDAVTGSTGFTVGNGINIYSVSSGNGKISITGAEL